MGFGETGFISPTRSGKLTGTDSAGIYRDTTSSVTNCTYAEYAIMFAFTPESFPGPVRGTGTGVATTLLHLGGLVASFISTYSGYTVVPICASAALWVLVGSFCVGLPFETHGHAAL